jgi:hypothetical protein
MGVSGLGEVGLGGGSGVRAEGVGELGSGAEKWGAGVCRLGGGDTLAGGGNLAGTVVPCNMQYAFLLDTGGLCIQLSPCITAADVTTDHG